MNDSRTRKSRSSRPLDAELEKALLKVFGFPHLRPGQEEVIRSVLDGADTLAVMPTGAGKSLCYQLPALQFEGMTIVVSPLISLMRDQAAKLAEAGVATRVLNSTLKASEAREAMQAIADHAVRILFVTPERLVDAEFNATLLADGMPEVPLVVIDEAHCISQWGHDFRPAYVELIHAVKTLGRPPVLALTATATPAVVTDIVRELQMRHANVIHTGVYRENLHFSVEQLTNPEEKRARAIERVSAMQGSGIVYCSTVAECEALHAALVDAGVEAERYHGKLAASVRSEAQDAFMEDRVRVMVATNAFGMGIDKPDIRFVLHAQMPGSLDAYYQEAGRAGRDGEPADCILLFEMKDKQVQQFFLGGRYPSAETIRLVAETVCKLAKEDAGHTLQKPLERLQEAMPNIGANKLRVAATLLNELGMTRRTQRGGMKLIDDGAAFAHLDQAAGAYTARAERDRAVLERMITYVQSAQCRWRIVLDYFAADIDDAKSHELLRQAEMNYRSPEDELGGKTCGACDNCLHPPEISVSAREEREHARVDEASKPLGKLKTFEAGDRVRVRRYGVGTVEMMSGESVAVRFADDSTRTFVAQFVKRAS
ncbi:MULTISPECIES: ATP-dependent DNA helicase RecQ [unclassified Caballeronia]|uniref:RecQ family ATP-dependent DNA helicase n=1 Tax=unclassified Caballeronia TaxID=2646786 RepID=UPI0020280B7B|nr:MULTISPECIES: ATP-dependent DNA helicase RecQ [unclassified Caballeronia]MDR5773775.1 ATP-dependent DNA helicase [Caballeronia sp. LZ002]MDR5849210.1 ATP-dependent DNA helicase [Caballeronia sp. LZ003]